MTAAATLASAQLRPSGMPPQYVAMAPAAQPTLNHRNVARMRLFMIGTVPFGGVHRQRTFVLPAGRADVLGSRSRAGVVVGAEGSTSGPSSAAYGLHGVPGAVHALSRHSVPGPRLPAPSWLICVPPL